MNLAQLTELARPPEPAEAAAVSWFALDGDDDVLGLLAFFGARPELDGALLTIEGEDAGYVARTDLYAGLGGRTLGFGDSLRWNLPGTAGSWRPTELRCPVAGCRPHYVVRFDPEQPPNCPLHGQQLSLAP